MSVRYFHGGFPGLKAGDLIRPEADTPGWKRDDCEWCQSGADDSHQPDRVFVTAERIYGKFYASRYGRGDLYVVEPIGELVESDNDLSIPSWSCSAARVLSVYERQVLLSMSERRRVFRLAGGSPYEFDQMLRAVPGLVRKGSPAP